MYAVPSYARAAAAFALMLLETAFWEAATATPPMKSATECGTGLRREGRYTLN